MHARDGDAVLEAHQFGEHFGTLDDGDFSGVGGLDFRIFRIDGRAGNDDRGAGDVFRGVAFVNGGAELRQPIGDLAAAQVGAGDFKAQVQQDFGNAAHADAADTDEVRVLGSCEHEGESSM